MAYKSMDEIEQFRFDDCQIDSFRTIGQDLILEVEALIVRANNSQNTNYTESYADTTNQPAWRQTGEGCEGWLSVL